jgi:D-alanyl-D-alanine endopeptidase (penicillin-binding protein 7)
MRRALITTLFVAILTTGLPTGAFAATAIQPATKQAAKPKVSPLEAVYAERTDLQAWFDTSKAHAVKLGAPTETISLDDWAKQYGWRTDKRLLAFRPKGLVPMLNADHAPIPDMTTAAYIVIDRKTGQIITAKDAATIRPIASLTKLVTADVVLGYGLSKSKTRSITKDDMVGGSGLGVKAGSKFTIDDLFYATFLVSANDAANALARATGLSKPKFVAKMNAKAKKLGLARTAFADPTGIDVGNASTPREFAIIADEAFKLRDVRRYATTAKRKITILPKRVPLTLKNSDGLLWKDEYADLLVSAGKTGYLGPEYGWTLAVALKDGKNANNPELLLVLFGTETLKQSMINAETLARWAWSENTWKKS